MEQTVSQTLSQTPAPFAALAAKRGGSLPSFPAPLVRYGLAGQCLARCLRYKNMRKMSGVTKQRRIICHKYPSMICDRLVLGNGLDPRDIC